MSRTQLGLAPSKLYFERDKVYLWNKASTIYSVPQGRYKVLFKKAEIKFKIAEVKYQKLSPTNQVE